MGFDEEAVTGEQREACAVVVMRTMLEDWCDDTGVPFDDALDAFASSRTYELLFDFSSRQWPEGPDNLRFAWEQERTDGKLIRSASPGAPLAVQVGAPWQDLPLRPELCGFCHFYVLVFVYL